VLTTTRRLRGCGPGAGRFRLLVATGIRVALRVARRTRRTPGRVPWSAPGHPGTGRTSAGWSPVGRLLGRSPLRRLGNREPAHPASTIPGRLRRVASRRERRADHDPDRRRAVHRLRAGRQRAGGTALRPGRGARGSDAAHGNRGPPVDRGLPREPCPHSPTARAHKCATLSEERPAEATNGRTRGASAPRGVNAIKLNSRGQIVQLTSIWDGSLVTPAWITQHMSLTIES
jgi:hypothetical protein